MLFSRIFMVAYEGEWESDPRPAIWKADQSAALPLSYPLRVGSEVYTGHPDPLSSSHAPVIRIASGAIKPMLWPVGTESQTDTSDTV